MRKSFEYAPKVHLLWTGSLLIALLLYWLWLYSFYVAELSFGCLLLPGLLLLGVWLRCLSLLSQRLTLTEEGLIYQSLGHALTVPYADIYYARRNPSRLIGLSLITRQGQLDIGRYLGNFGDLSAGLEARLPRLTTPRRPLPWSLRSGTTGLVFWSLGTFFFLSLAIFLSVVTITAGPLWLLVVALLSFGLAELFVYKTLTQPVGYLFTPETITIQTLLEQQHFAVAGIKTIYKAPALAGRFGRRPASYRMVIEFAAGATLKIKASQIDYPFDEFYPILKSYYAPAAPVELPWRRQMALVPFKKFAKGSLHDFKWYFERESQTPVSSIADICHWLRSCRYIRDDHHFQMDDYWQHPLEFERTRQGDCEDHALWAWRKLVELDIEAEFVVGDLEAGYHAWVMFKRNGRYYILEAVNKAQDIISPVENVQRAYRPHYSVDRHFVTYRYETQRQVKSGAERILDGPPDVKESNIH